MGLAVTSWLAERGGTDGCSGVGLEIIGLVTEVTKDNRD